jgi:hypothetical protein
MAEIRNIDSAEKSKHQLVDELSDHVSALGLTVMLRILKVVQLKLMLKLCDTSDDRTPTNKTSIAKKIQETMEEIGPRKFLEKLDSLVQREIIKSMEVDIPAAKRDYVDTILQTTEEMGMENFLSSFPTSKLKEFVKVCKLKVDSDCLDTLLKALIEQESIKAPYVPAEGEPLPSKIKPEIDKNISTTDLYHHYYREDLVNFLETVKTDDDKKLTTHGSKKELVERIRRFFDKKTEDKDEKKERIRVVSKEKQKEKEKEKEREKKKKTVEEEEERSSDSARKKGGGSSKKRKT